MSTSVSTVRPPFPFQGTLSIESARINAPPATDRGLLTLPRQPITKILHLTRVYLWRFDPNAPIDGQILMVRGEHGAGKTHALRYLMETVQRERARERAPTVHQIYVKVEGPDFVKLYQEAAALVPPDLLRDLSLRFLGVMATEQLQRTAPADRTDKDQRVLQEVENRLRDSPQRVFELFSQYQVEAGAAEERRTLEVERVAGGMRDFNRALSYLLSSELATAAYDWLVGRPITDEQTERLGVSGPIASPIVAKWALQLLVTLFSRAGRPLILYVDQYEKLILEEDRLVNQNVGLLHTLVEFVPRAGGMLVVCGSNYAWKALPADLEQRFGANVVELPILQLQEGRDLVRLYQTPPDHPFELGRTADEDLRPFNNTAIRQILSFSAGNLRRFLQICAQAWELSKAGSQTINSTLVEAAVKQISATAYFDKETATSETAKLLRQRGLVFSEDVKLGGGQVSFAVHSPPGTLRLVVDVKHAFFHYDEARRALESLNLRAQLAKEKIPAIYVLIVLGYVSPEIVTQVRTFVHELVIYEPASFRARFENVLDHSLSSPADESVRLDELERHLSLMRTSLEKIALSRDSNADEIEQRIMKLLERQGADMSLSRRQITRETWSHERKQIEERIRSARAARAAASLEEFHRLAENASNRLTRRQRLIGLVGGLYAGSMSLVLGFDHSYLARYISILSAGGLAAIGLLLPNLMGMLSISRKELDASPSSFEELDRMARDIAKNNKSVAALVSSRFPLRRYAGALAARDQADLDELMSALRAEPSRLVRIAIAKRAGQMASAPSGDSWGTLISALQSIPDAAYCLEILGARGVLGKTDDLPLPLATLLAIAGVAATPPRRPTVAYDLATGLQHGPDCTQPQEILAEAFELGPDRYAWSRLPPPGRQRIADALAELSPFDGGGLGMLDESQNIKRIDQFYLFFRHLEFLLESDLIDHSLHGAHMNLRALSQGNAEPRAGAAPHPGAAP